ncbi:MULTISPECIES: hypothetical protein [Streptomyces]|uniref:Uncharacterized protein n=1 Tax=Streptomyces nymphaeiformis TaxID=2663842 RepID=A0A7W7TZV6_9ACTN|nr:hypothetical protein [Streptomyces nymphaeiformis]MBB4981045.1 hypothetical protein [Streptomyces nymphaeiformis]
MTAHTTTPGTPATGERSSLTRLCPSRGILAVVWAPAIAGAHRKSRRRATGTL